MKRGELIFNVLLVPLDFVMLLVAGVFTYLLRTHLLSIVRPVQFELNLPFERYMVLVSVVALIFIVMYAISGLYVLKTTRRFVEEFFKIAIASSAGVMAVIVYIFVAQELFDSRFLVLGAWLMAIISVSIGRLLARQLQKFLTTRFDIGIHKVLVIGDDSVTDQLIDGMIGDRRSGYRIVKKLANPQIEEVISAVGNPGIDEVILANPNFPSEKVVDIIEFCNEHHLTFRFVPNIYQTLTTNYAVDSISGVPLVELKRTTLDGWGRVFKRGVDIVGSLIGLIILSPVFAIISFAIKWETRGPVLIRLERVSRNQQFWLYKFRSMIRNAESYKHLLLELNERKDSPLFKMKNDPRVTHVGRFLRRYRLDELPQLWNVFMGNISLVGPRPHQPDEIARYQKHHKRVLAIKAGVTGLAQVSGSSNLPFEEEVSLDTLYIENWSFAQDIKILLLTLLKLVRDSSAV